MYDEIEAQIRAKSTLGRPTRALLLEAVLIFLAFLILGYMLFMAQFSGAVRWLLGLLLIGVVAGFAWYEVNRRTREPSPLLTPAPKLQAHAGELTTLMAVVRRADRGLLYSQVLISSRAREALSEQTRLSLGLSREDMRRLVRDPDALRRALHDPVLEAFLYTPSRDPDWRYRWVEEARASLGFEASLRTVLDHMEAWR